MPRFWWRDTTNHENRPDQQVASNPIFVLNTLDSRLHGNDENGHQATFYDFVNDNYYFRSGTKMEIASLFQKHGFAF
jgi:hypothetical protein